MKALALAVVVMIVLAVTAHHQQQTSAVVSCGRVTGGTTLTAKGVTWAQHLGEWVHDIAETPIGPDTVKAAVKGIEKVLWFWLRTAFLSAKGVKLDPEILRLQEAQQAAQQAADQQCTPCPQTPPDTQDSPPLDSLTLTSTASSGRLSEQERIATIAAAEAAQRNLPRQALVDVLMAGYVESGIRNLNYGDRDSLGWLQQRAGWGTPAQRRDPGYAAGKFYDALVRVRDWQTRPAGEVVQAVQISAFPGRYAAYETRARQLAAKVAGNPPPTEETSGAAPIAGCATGTVSMSSVAPVDGPTPAGFNFFGQRTVEQAIAYMQAQQSSTAWGGRCLALVGRAYGNSSTQQVNGHHWATGQWDAMPAKYKHADGSIPPRGALIFWDTSNVAGHVAISAGGGYVWTSDPPGGRPGSVGKVPITSIDRWGYRLGWSAPYFVGRTSVSA